MNRNDFKAQPIGFWESSQEGAIFAHFAGRPGKFGAGEEWRGDGQGASPVVIYRKAHAATGRDFLVINLRFSMSGKVEGSAANATGNLFPTLAQTSRSSNFSPGFMATAESEIAACPLPMLLMETNRQPLPRRLLSAAAPILFLPKNMSRHRAM